MFSGDRTAGPAHRIEVFTVIPNPSSNTSRSESTELRSPHGGRIEPGELTAPEEYSGSARPQGRVGRRWGFRTGSTRRPSAAGGPVPRDARTEANDRAAATHDQPTEGAGHDHEATLCHRDPAGQRPDPAASRSPVDSLAVSAMIMLAVTVIQRGVGFSRGILFCRWLDPTSLGQWELAFSFILLAAPLSVLGLPGSFGRYVAHYQKRGQLRMFLRRTASWTFLLGTLAVATVMLAAPHVAWLVFGDAGRGQLVLLMAFSLAAVILQHFLESLLAALRMFRAVSLVQFCQSFGFATIGLTLVLLWRADARSIVVAYGSACLVASVAALLWIRSALRSVHDTGPAPAAVAFWRQLLRFSIWVWIVNLLANLFVIVDRYMIIHYSHLTSSQAITEVGQYHSSRIVPVLLVSIAELVGSMIMPYLSHDWEDGRRRSVSRTLKLAVKLVACGMLVASWIILLGAPLLFGIAFEGKYAGGERVLPWTLAYSGLFGIAVVAQNYLWCAEKARLCSVPVLIGLVTNIGLNMLLLPPLGLLGAVLATTAANVAMLLVGMWLVREAGMEIDRGTWILVVLPVVIGFGPWVTGLVVLAVSGTIIGTDFLVTRGEKRRLLVVAARAMRGVRQRVPRGLAWCGLAGFS